MTLLSVMGVAVPSTYERHQVVIARLTAFIAANYARPLYLAEFCVATGVPERTLRACCQAQLGMSPIRYLLLHLDAACAASSQCRYAKDCNRHCSRNRAWFL